MNKNDSLDTVTPRTDAEEIALEELVRKYTNTATPTQVVVSGMKLVRSDFARTLERELLSAQAALAAKDAEIAHRKAQLDMWTSAAMDGNAVIAQLTARAEKAEAQLDSVCYGRQKEAEQYREVLIRLTKRAEKAEAERDALRTLWTEARVVVAQCRDANCLVSYGKAQCDAVAAANAWLDKMPATVKRTIDDAGNAEWQLQRVTAERDQLRAEVENIKAWGNAKADEAQELRADLAAAKVDSELLNWLADQDFPENVFTTDHGMPGCWTPQSLRAAIDAARKAQP